MSKTLRSVTRESFERIAAWMLPAPPAPTIPILCGITDLVFSGPNSSAKTLSCDTAATPIRHSHRDFHLQGRRTTRLELGTLFLRGRVNQRHAGIALQATLAEMHVARIVASGHGTSAAGEHIEVINIVPMSCNNGMVAILDQYYIAIDESQGVVARSRGVVQSLECISLRFADPVVVRFVEVHFKRGVVSVMFVRGIA